MVHSLIPRCLIISDLIIVHSFKIRFSAAPSWDGRFLCLYLCHQQKYLPGAATGREMFPAGAIAGDNAPPGRKTCPAGAITSYIATPGRKTGPAGAAEEAAAPTHSPRPWPPVPQTNRHT